jgi:hypothetical protein
LFLVLSVLISSPAFAQSWQVEVTPEGYTDYTHTTSSGSWSYPFPELGDWDGDSGYLPIWTAYGDTVTLNASGKYKIKATWVGANGLPTLNPPPPDKVILVTTAYTNYMAPEGMSVSNTDVDNGIDSPELSSYPNSGYAYGIKYEVLNGSSGTVEKTVTQSAKITATATMAPDGEGHVWVGHSVSASAIPVFITRNGQQAADPTNKVLPGEKNQLSVSAGGLTQSGHSWSASGNTMFDFETVNNPNPDLSHGRKISVTQFNDPSFLFYYAGGEGAKSVSCSLIIEGISVTVNGELNLAQPIVTNLANTWGLDDMADVRFNPVSPSVPSAVGLFHNPSATTDDFGIIWTAQVTIPEDWKQGGSVSTAQLVQPNMKYKEVGGTRRKHRHYGDIGIDGSFPYQNEVGSVDQLYVGADQPEMGLSGNLEVSVDTMTFVTYLMFKPAGTGNCWVPLKKFGWGWTASASLTPPWALTNAGKYKSGWGTVVDHPLWEFAALPDDFIDD